MLTTLSFPSGFQCGNRNFLIWPRWPWYPQSISRDMLSIVCLVLKVASALPKQIIVYYISIAHFTLVTSQRYSAHWAYAARMCIHVQ